MADDSCEHGAAVGGVCTGCGLCMGDDDLVDTCAANAPGGRERVNFKYAVKSQHLRLSCTAQCILAAFNLECYASQITALLGTVRFTVRLSGEDKVAVLLYHLCIRDGFPITLTDILRYTKTNKFRFLKAHRDAFSYCRPSEAYLRAIFNREMHEAEACGIATSVTFERFAELAGVFVAANASDLCLAAILRFATCRGRFIKLDSVESEKKARIMRLFRRLAY